MVATVKSVVLSRSAKRGQEQYGSGYGKDIIPATQDRHPGQGLAQSARQGQRAQEGLGAYRQAKIETRLAINDSAITADLPLPNRALQSNYMIKDIKTGGAE
jgi:hypothetical protein